MTTSHTKLLGLLGHPVSHSRSPAIHTAALAALGVDATYLAFDVPEPGLASAVAGLDALGALGVNVTVPHKVAVMGHLDGLDSAASAIGAVNTITRDGDGWVGRNTDAPGLVRSLLEADVDPTGANVLVLGAGGAARAAVVGLSEAAASGVTIAARRLDRAEALVSSVETRAPLHAADLKGLQVGQFDLLIQATSATMGPHAETFARSLPIAELPDHATVMDLVYAPLETTVLAAARARGLRTVDGLGMLIWQAALALEHWLALPEALPPAVIASMRAAALATLSA